VPVGIALGADELEGGLCEVVVVGKNTDLVGGEGGAFRRGRGGISPEEEGEEGVVLGGFLVGAVGGIELFG